MRWSWGWRGSAMPQTPPRAPPYQQSPPRPGPPAALASAGRRGAPSVSAPAVKPGAITGAYGKDGAVGLERVGRWEADVEQVGMTRPPINPWLLSRETRAFCSYA